MKADITSKYSQLPVPDLAKKREAPWNIRTACHEENAKITQNEELRVLHEEGKWSNDSGLVFRATPFDKFPAEKAGVRCKVYVPKDFPWTLGGKFAPGFCLGDDETSCASGGDWQRDAGSVRISWYHEGPSACPYIYLPTQVGGGNNDKSVDVQSKDFKRAADTTDRTGIHMWRGVFKLKEDKWNDIELELELNTPGKENGVLSCTVNGTTRRLDNVIWRTSSKVKINQFLFASFFGGGSRKYAPKKDTFILYKDFSVYASP